MDALKGAFIVFEGADGSGKTTQFRRFLQACRDRGLPVCDVVLADRFVQSTIAYQGAAGGLGGDEIRAVAKVACAGAEPDLIVVFDIENGEAARRVGPTKDRIEARDEAFHAKVRKAYLDMARAEPERFVVINGGHDPDEVHRATMRAIESRLAPDAAGAGGR